MTRWTPEQVFICTYVVAALSGLAVLLRSDEPLTPRSILATVLFYGSAGTGMGMIGFEWLGGKQNPWRVIGCGMLVGIRIIRLNDIKIFLQRVLGSTNGSEHKKP